MPPCQEVVEEGIAGEDIVLELLRMLVAPFAHENFHRISIAARRHAAAPILPPSRGRARSSTL
jgi:hypothetical protein